MFQIGDLAEISKNDENSKINVNDFEIRSKTVPDYKILDNVRILQTILSKHLPAERSNGIIDLIYVARPSATSEEIQSALVKTILSLFTLMQFKSENSFIENFRTIYMALRRRHPSTKSRK